MVYLYIVLHIKTDTTMKENLKGLNDLVGDAKKANSIEELHAIGLKAKSRAQGCERLIWEVLDNEIRGMASKEQSLDYYRSMLPITITMVMISVSGMGLLEIDRILSSF